MDKPPLEFDRRSAADWLAEALRFERMADRFRENPDLSHSFSMLADDARKRARQRLP